MLDIISKKENLSNYLLIIYGPVNQDVIISTIRLAETKLKLQQFPPTLISKAKTICAEILQNITKHQIKHEAHQPYLIIGSQDNDLCIYSGNIISENSRNNITAKLENYSNVKDKDFKNFYVDAFKNSTLTEEGNAGLGLLDVLYRSNRNVKYKIEKVAESLYSFNISIELHHNALILT